MKFLLSLTVLTLLFGLSALAQSEIGPLKVHRPDGWDLKYQGDNGVQLYTLTKTDGENVLLMFSRWPALGKQEDMPAFLDSMAGKFLEAAKDNPKIKLASTSYTKGEFLGVAFNGKFVAFTLEGGLTQTMFMFSDGDGIWNGQYTGPSAQWLDALEILKVVKKNG